LDKELANFAWLKPVSITVFPGKFDPASLRFPYNLIPALKNMPPSDERDWEAIRAWAIEIAGVIQEKAQ
jgi:menaquinone-dependent protoporphyrinogen oxidase